jgi:hypothetical protein
MVNSKFRIQNLKVSDVVSLAGVPVSHISFCDNTGVDITQQKFLTLRDACVSLLERNSENSIHKKTAHELKTFFYSVKKGSKHIRTILTERNTGTVPHNLIKFAETADIVINAEMAPKINGLWGLSFLDNSTRTFLFKLHNNTLGINSRIHHFVQGQSKNCTFCELMHNPEEESETILHLFFQCQHTEPIVLGFLEWLVNNREISETFTRTNFFGTFGTGNLNLNKFLQLSCVLLKKFIWDCKMRFTLPNLELCKDWIKAELDRILSHNKKIRDTYNGSGLNFYRE